MRLHLPRLRSSSLSFPHITGGKWSISDAITPTEKYAYILPLVYWIHSLPTRNTKNPKKVSVPSGLRANYEKPAYHNPNQELDSDDGEDSPVRYGGLICDDEGDKVKKRGVKKSRAKKSNDENVEFCSFIYMLSTVTTRYGLLHYANLIRRTGLIVFFSTYLI
jgi:hypothetical protein